MPTFQEAKFQNAMDGAVLAMREKTSFLLNKSTTQCPRPIAIKPHFLFCFVLHAHFPSHMTAFLSKSWANFISWEPTLFLKGSSTSLALGIAHATGHSPTVHTKLQPEARHVQPPWGESRQGNGYS